MKKILITGGAGYIGTHTIVELQQNGYDIVVVDNFTNSNPEALARVRQLTAMPIAVHAVDLLDRIALNEVFRAHPISAVIHFAGLKSVGESVAEPLRYYHNNLTGTLVLLECMAAHQVKQIVFSSSACVYGDPNTVPICEDFPVRPSNPYGWSKLMIEQILMDARVSDPTLQVAILRYFNPVGAHPSGRIGEDPTGIPNNLMPYIAQVAVGRLTQLSVFGGDYPTPDGTGVRDYIHVVDLARGHLHALRKLESNPGLILCNLGTGRGYSVLEMVEAFAQAAGKDIPHVITARRPGDIATCYADPTRAREMLGWQAELGLEEMCRDHWRWQVNNPSGYKTEQPTNTNFHPKNQP
ncbi:MAG: UDP-glucose 4-epimerase GalE [Proteobacteria bacterium]|nr:UDP-glucose 4-epimerase GalE [Pseudomonadota bacterium]